MCIRGSKNNRELLLSDLKAIPWINEFSEHNIVITGGEPTLCKEFENIVSYLSGIAKTVSICTNATNGTYISKSFFKPNVKIQISLDGTKEFHDIIRGQGSFDRTLSTISKLEDLEIQYTISSVVSTANYKCMKNLADTLSTLNHLSYWNISYEMPFGNASINELMTAEEWNSFVDDMLDYVDFRMKIQKMFPFDLFDNNKDRLRELLHGKRCSNCGSGSNKIYIYPDLTVYPCTCLTDFPLGNFSESSLHDIMRNEKARIFSEYTVLNDSVCHSCEYLEFCNGGCIGMSYNYSKKIGMGDVRCPKIRNAK